MFTDTLRRWAEGLQSAQNRWNFYKIVEPIFDRMSSACLVSPALVISSGGATTAKTGASDVYGISNGILWKVAAATTLPALVGSITATKFNVFCFFVDQAGTVTVAMGTEGAAIANVVFPQFPTKKALLGFLIVTYASQFVGGTTPLDTATTVYVSSNEAFDPACLIGN